jgi:hypothetical protein
MESDISIGDEIAAGGLEASTALGGITPSPTGAAPTPGVVPAGTVPAAGV